MINKFSQTVDKACMCAGVCARVNSRQRLSRQRQPCRVAVALPLIPLPDRDNLVEMRVALDCRARRPLRLAQLPAPRRLLRRVRALGLLCALRHLGRVPLRLGVERRKMGKFGPASQP